MKQTLILMILPLLTGIAARQDAPKKLDTPAEWGVGKEILLDVPEYDFNWQLSYELEEPLLVPPGTKIRAIAHFDNSEANPDPNATVRFGPQTFDEMLIGYFDYTETP
jgi:hypothetical protein